MKNPNHPPKGSRITVDPFPERAIGTIKRLLSDKPRDLLLFTLGINNGLRVGDLLQLRIRDVLELQPGDTVKLRERKTGKVNYLGMNKTSRKVLDQYLANRVPNPDDYLFKSKKGYNQPLSVGTVSQLVKGWAKEINLPGNYASHSLRKTFGYIQRKKYGVSWEILSKRFNHSHPSTTMRYLGLFDEEVNNILFNEI